MKRCEIHIISYNPKDTFFIWDVITFLVTIAAYISYKFKNEVTFKLRN